MACASVISESVISDMSIIYGSLNQCRPTARTK